MRYKDIHVGDILTVSEEDRTYRYRCIAKDDRRARIEVKTVAEYSYADGKYVSLSNGEIFKVDASCFQFKVPLRGTIL